VRTLKLTVLITNLSVVIIWLKATTLKLAVTTLKLTVLIANLMVVIMWLKATILKLAVTTPLS
jgi:hypothetical protein